MISAVFTATFSGAMRNIFPCASLLNVSIFASCFLSLTIAGSAGEITAGGRITLRYDESAWQRIPKPEASGVIQLTNDHGGFSVMVMPEKRVPGGMSSPEARRTFFEQLSRNHVRTGEIRKTEVGGKSGYEFMGSHALDGATYRIRIVLIVDAGDILVVTSGAIDRDPMSVPSIAAIWESLSFPDRPSENTR